MGIRFKKNWEGGFRFLITGLRGSRFYNFECGGGSIFLKVGWGWGGGIDFFVWGRGGPIFGDLLQFYSFDISMVNIFYIGEQSWNFQFLCAQRGREGL